MTTQPGAVTAPTTPMCSHFPEFSKPVHDRFVELSKGELFVTDVGDGIFDAYLAVFPEGTNPIFRKRPVYDCQTCKQFIRRLGKLVGIKDGKVQTVWGGLSLPQPFQAVADALDTAVRAAKVVSVFRSKERAYGVEYNYDSETNDRYDHFWGEVAARHHTPNPGSEIGKRHAVFQVMTRGLVEIREVDLVTVLGLIDANDLYRGEEHRGAVAGFLELFRAFWAGGGSELFVWENLDNRNALFRNTVIGTLLTDLAEGKDLDQAVKAFETKVAPANYKRPTAPITQKMVDDALATLNRLDLGGAVLRRYARLSDVSVNDVLFVDNDVRGVMKDGHGLSALLEGSVKKTAPDLKHAVKIAADDFLKDVLPGAKTLAAFVENRHQGNFVSLTGADGPERLFRWDNNFAWSYEGDLADSVKQRVKAAGGKIDCKLRVSLSWFNTDDLDLHAMMPDGTYINFTQKHGILDVDMNAHSPVRNPVENLAFNHLWDGVYRVWVNQYRRRETVDVGFAIEVEFAGALQQYSYAKSLKDREDVQCFQLHVKKGVLEKVDVGPGLVGGSASQDKWGVKTETLVPVVAAMYSPNHWGDNKVGARHLILILRNCRRPGSARGFFNEYLRADLEPHRKVFEVLGSKTMISPSDEQLSGVGFTGGRGDSVTVVVDGGRAYTLTF